MPTQCTPLSFTFQGVRGRSVTAAFDGGSITSNAGALLLRRIDRALGLFDRVAACFTDHRDPRLTEHSVVLADLFIESWQGLPPERLVLDIDSTDDPVHGQQEGRFYHGYYGHYCLLPLYILCAGRPLFAQLRPGGADPAGDVNPEELVVRAPRHREGRASGRQGEPPLRGHLAARGHLLGPHRLRASVLPAGRRGEHDQGAAAGSLLRPDVGHLFRRQPAPAPLLRLRVGPLRRAQAGAPRHPARARHRRNAAAQASQDRSPRPGVGAPRQGSHGLRTPLRRGLRPRPRATTGVTSKASRSPTASVPPSWDPCVPEPAKASSGRRFWSPKPTKALVSALFPHPQRH